MTIGFDQRIAREGTSSVKWDGRLALFGDATVLPMWVADMDFLSPQPVIDALQERVAHGVFGYTRISEDYIESVARWQAKRHGWEVQASAISHAPGVVPALSLLVQALTQPGDEVIIQPPVYPPFFDVVRRHQRKLVESPLVYRAGRYEIDFADLEQKARTAKLFIFCSPHNPVGRVWTRDELLQLSDICRHHDVTVISDEIHGDLVFSPHQHVPFASLSEDAAQRTVTCVAASKTFNVAGFHTASVIAENQHLQELYRAQMALQSMGSINPLAMTAVSAAYDHGESWLEALLPYLATNCQLVIDTLHAAAPEIRVTLPEGTYLLWIDFRALDLADDALGQLLLERAQIALNLGKQFGVQGEGFARLNVGCPRPMLVEAATRLAQAVRG